MPLSTSSSCPAHVHRNEATKAAKERGGVGRGIPTEDRVGGYSLGKEVVRVPAARPDTGLDRIMYCKSVCNLVPLQEISNSIILNMLR